MYIKIRNFDDLKMIMDGQALSILEIISEEEKMDEFMQLLENRFGKESITTIEDLYHFFKYEDDLIYGKLYLDALAEELYE